MALSDIAAGIEVTTQQRERGVAAVDDTGALVDRLRPHTEALPCTPDAAATVLETHAAGTSVEASAREAGLTPVTAAKALHRCGVSGVTPLAPTARQVVRDWQAGELSRADALELTGADAAEFALAAYIESHDADPGLSTAAADADTVDTNREALAETMPDVDDFL